MGAHASHDDDDEDTEDESSSDEENDPWNTLINDAVSKVWDQYKEILQELLMEGHDESKAKEEAFVSPTFSCYCSCKGISLLNISNLLHFRFHTVYFRSSTLLNYHHFACYRPKFEIAHLVYLLY